MNSRVLGAVFAVTTGIGGQQPPGSIAARAHVEKAITLRDRGDTAAALGEFLAAAELDPRNGFAHREIGLILLNTRDFAGASAAFRKATEVDPHDAESRYNLALSLANGGQPERGVAEIHTVLREKPGWAMAFFGLGHIYSLEGKRELAEQAFRTALRLDPRFARARFELGKLLEESGDRNGALREFEAAADASPEFAAARYRMAKLLQHSGQLDRSSAELAATREIAARRSRGEQAALAYKQGTDLIEKGNLQEGVRELERAVSLRPDFVEIRGVLADARRQWGASLEDQRDVQGALLRYGESLVLEADPVLENHVGILLAKAGQVDAAIDHFRAALALRPGYRNAETNLEQAITLKRQLPPSSR